MNAKEMAIQLLGLDGYLNSLRRRYGEQSPYYLANKMRYQDRMKFQAIADQLGRAVSTIHYWCN